MSVGGNVSEHLHAFFFFFLIHKMSSQLYFYNYKNLFRVARHDMVLHRLITGYTLNLAYNSTEDTQPCSKGEKYVRKTV